MKKTILLTGATGFVGSRLLLHLIDSGYAVACLVRPGAGQKPPQRLVGALQAAGQTRAAAEKKLAGLNVLPGDVTLPSFGLPEQQYAALKQETGMVFHCAASTTFAPRKQAEQWQVNVTGTRQIIDFATRGSAVKHVHSISTAYVAGDRRGVIYENELQAGQAFNNNYEKSKYAAESLLTGLREQSGVTVTIYRPSIIVGDFDTGRTANFTGIYQYLRFLELIKPSFAGQPANGRTRLPVRAVGNPSTTKNLVPADYVVSMIAAVLSRPDAYGKTYHVTNRRPPVLRELQEAIEEVLHICGTAFVDNAAFNVNPPTEVEKLLMQETQVYQPYLLGEPRFDAGNLQAALGDTQACTCPLMDRAALIRLFEFPLKTNWGKRRARAAKAVNENTVAAVHTYFDRFVPAAARRSVLAELDNLDVVFELHFPDICLRKTVVMHRGQVLPDHATGVQPSETTYELDTATFFEIAAGTLPPRQAFLANKAKIHGDRLKGIKLASIFEAFIQEHPFHLDALK